MTKFGQITLPVSHAYIYNQCIFVRVCQFLSSTTTISTINSSSITRKLARRKKTNRLLISASIIFFISWAPLNIYNLVLDIFSPFDVSRLFIFNDIYFLLGAKRRQRNRQIKLLSLFQLVSTALYHTYYEFARIV